MKFHWPNVGGILTLCKPLKIFMSDGKKLRIVRGLCLAAQMTSVVSKNELTLSLNKLESLLWRCWFAQCQRMPGFALMATHWHGAYTTGTTAHLRRRKEMVSEAEGCVSKQILIKELQQIFRNVETFKRLHKPYGTTCNYSAISDIHILQLTVIHALGC
jgi:hypothetical protein